MSPISSRPQNRAFQTKGFLQWLEILYQPDSPLRASSR